ncbi:MAG: hypothetical protein ACOYK7_01710 [Pirellulales bacterium]
MPARCPPGGVPGAHACGRRLRDMPNDNNDNNVKKPPDTPGAWL